MAEFLLAGTPNFLLDSAQPFDERQCDDCSDGFDETLRRSHGGGGHFVHGRARRNCRFARTEWRGQKHDHADSFVFPAGDVRHGARRGLRCVLPVGGSAPPHRLHAGKQSAVSRNARAGIPEIPRAAQGPQLAAFARARDHGDGAMRVDGGGPAHHRPAFQGLQAAGRSGGRAGA